MYFSSSSPSSSYARLPTDSPKAAANAPLSMPTFIRRPSDPSLPLGSSSSSSSNSNSNTARRRFSWPKTQLLLFSKRFLALALLLFLCSQLAWLSATRFGRSAAAASDPTASRHSGWVTFDAQHDSPFLVRLNHSAPPTEQELLFTEACRDLWVSRNRLCPALQARWFAPGLLARSQKFDIVHTWQDGSDPLQAQAREAELLASATQGQSGDAIRHFRIHDELRHSLRSVFKAFGRHARAIKNFYFLSTDLPTSDPAQRMGMAPKWLDLRHPFHQHAQIHPVFPWNAHKTSAFATPQEAHQWRSHALPVFNSMAVESQFTNMPTSSDIWLMSCDDMFLLNDMTPSDVYTPLFGPVVRLRYSNMAQPAQHPSEYHGDKDNELQSLRHANWLMAQRFGLRPKYLYIEHIQKAYSKPILRELESVWAEELRDAGSVKFRGRGFDLNMHTLFIHFLIERHREAMLFSAIVLKADANHDGYIDKSELEAFLSPIGASSSQDSLDVAQPSRNVPWEDLLKEAGLPLPQQSKYEALSANGYSLARADGQTLGKSRWINYAMPGPRRFCTLHIQQCFRPDSSGLQDSGNLLKHVAFSRPECGDCLIMALLGASGTRGMEAFLPPKNQDTFGSHPDTQILDTPVLPLTKTWQEADYSISANVPRDSSLRSFATRLLSRYAYTNGWEAHRLLMIMDEKSANDKLGAIEPPTIWNLWNRLSHNPSWVAVNDDIERDEEKVEHTLASWFHAHWPNPLEWEMDQ